jgi:hypothetical protein
MEAKLAEAHHAAEMQAAEAKLAETKRAVETTLAEARQAQARLEETKHAVEVSMVESKPAVRPAVETRYVDPSVNVRPASTGYASCDTCGTVTSVSTRIDRGTHDIEVRVHFTTGRNWVFLYPSDPGLWNGDRVRLQGGRLTRM